MDNLIQEKSGKLLSGYFYEFAVAGTEFYPPFCDLRNTILVKRNPPTDTLHDEFDLRVQVQNREDDLRRECPIDPTHVTSKFWTAPTVAVGNYGSRLSPFIFETLEEIPIVTGEFANQIKASGLTGYGLSRATVVENPNSIPVPELYVLSFRGRDCRRPLVVQGVPNACPFCGKHPIICPGCGDSFMDCPKCHEMTWTTRDRHKGPGDRQLIICPPELRTPEILEASKWDGSDFNNGIYSGYYITKRALDWLLSVHAAPFSAQPVLVNVEGISKEKMAKLEQSRQPLPATGK